MGDREGTTGPHASEVGQPVAAAAKPGGRPAFRRVLLKLSGLSFAEQGGGGIDLGRVRCLAHTLKKVHSGNVEMAVVVGGGNLFRGAEAARMGMDRGTADYTGMLATVMNALCLQHELERLGLETRLLTAIEMSEVGEPFIIRRALRHLEKGRMIIFAAGTGNPFFTTDTAAALRALQIRADVLLKATNVDGVYAEDPSQVEGARLLEEVTFEEALKQELRIMDSTAFSLCKDHGLPVVIFNIEQDVANICKAVFGERLGSTVGMECLGPVRRSSDEARDVE